MRLMYTLFFLIFSRLWLRTKLKTLSNHLLTLNILRLIRLHTLLLCYLLALIITCILIFIHIQILSWWQILLFNTLQKTLRLSSLLLFFFSLNFLCIPKILFWSNSCRTVCSEHVFVLLLFLFSSLVVYAVTR